MKTYILYHAHCSDGFGAAWAAWSYYGDAAEYLPVEYGRPVPALEPDSWVVILDFCYPLEELQALAHRMHTVQVIDHHPAAKQVLSGLPGMDELTDPTEPFKTGVLRVKFDSNKSGAVLAWEHYWPGKRVPELLLYVQDRDLWQWQMPHSKKVNAALRAHPFDFRIWSELNNRIEQLVQDGHVLLMQTDRIVKATAANARMIELGGFIVPCVNCTAYHSEVGNELLQNYPDAPFSATYRDVADRREWSLRSRRDFDCSAIARQFGGGGHPQACGFEETFVLFVLPSGNAPLSFDSLRSANLKRVEQVFHPLAEWSPTDWATAMAGECGEACNLIKKLRRGEDIPTVEIAHELADVVIYADLLAARLDINLGAAVATKFNIVSDRRNSTVKLHAKKEEA